MSYNIIQHTRHNSLSQFHVEKYLHQKTVTEWGYLPLNREAINLEITVLESTGMPCFVSKPEHTPLERTLTSSVPLYLTERWNNLNKLKTIYIYFKKECLAKAQIYTCQCTGDYHTWLEIVTAIWNLSLITTSNFQHFQYRGKLTDFQEEFGNYCNSS